MTKPNENKNENTLYSWATGKLASFAIGAAVAVFIYKSGILHQVFGKFFPKSTEKTKNDTDYNSETNT